MKKLLVNILSFLVIMLGSSAYATTQVFYGNTGVAKTVRYGATHTTSAYRYKSAFAPTHSPTVIRDRAIPRTKAMPRTAGQKYANCSRGYSQNISSSKVNTNTANNTSRFSKDFKISSTPKTYTKYGVTYFN